MKILVTTARDSANIHIENVVKKFIERGHEVVIYSLKTDDASIWMFKDLGIPIFPLKQMYKDDLSDFDIIFTPSSNSSTVAHLKKYVFGFSSAIPHYMPLFSSDFLFTVGKFPEDYSNYYAYMPVGVSKNDVQTAEKISEEKKILFVDSGHFPFSKKGKMQVAEMLLEICKRFPDYEICVKPRWLPNIKGEFMTHPNNIHIYDCIGEIVGDNLPPNLNLLYQQQNLQELIDSSTCVITMCSTAYLDVLARNKNLIIVKGFESNDTSTLRKEETDTIYAIAEKSGCVVDYRDVCNYLPQGIKCATDHLSLFYEYTSGASERVVNVIEYIYDSYLKNGIYPEFKEYKYESFFDLPVTPNNITLKEIMQNRYYDVGLRVISIKDLGIPDWSEYKSKIRKISKDVIFTLEGLNEFRETCKKEKYKFIIQNEKILRDNRINRHYYYFSLYNLEEYDRLLELIDTEEEHPSLNYYCGLIQYDRGHEEQGVNYLQRYFNEIKDNDYKTYTEEYIKYKNECFKRLCDYYTKKEDYEKLSQLMIYYLTEEYFNANNIKKWMEK